MEERALKCFNHNQTHQVSRLLDLPQAHQDAFSFGRPGSKHGILMIMPVIMPPAMAMPKVIPSAAI